MCCPFTNGQRAKVAVTDLGTKIIDGAYRRHYGEIMLFSGVRMTLTSRIRETRQ